MSPADSRFHEFDVLIIGSGAAGLSAALHLNSAYKIGVIAKTELDDGSTPYAQGGISAVMDASDSEHRHIQDTIDAGCGLCNPTIVEKTVKLSTSNRSKVSI